MSARDRAAGWLMSRRSERLARLGRRLLDVSVRQDEAPAGRPRGPLMRAAGRCRCGRQAVPGRETCRQCGSWLEGYFSQQDPPSVPFEHPLAQYHGPGDYTHTESRMGSAGNAAWAPAGPPPGETAGEVDMTEFEKPEES